MISDFIYHTSQVTVMFYMKSESVSKAMEVESHLDDF